MKTYAKLLAPAAVAAVAIWACGSLALAGPGIGMGGGGGMKGIGGANNGHGTHTPPQPKPPSGHCTLTRFTPAKDRAGDDAPQGVLSVRMDDKRTVRIDVPSTWKLTFGSKQFSGEDLERVLISGIMLQVDWNEEKVKARKTNSLTNANMLSVEVEGEVEKYDDKDGSLTVKLRSKSTTDPWPDEVARAGKNASKASKPGFRKMKLKTIESASELMDSSQHPINLPDLQAGQKIRGNIFFGKPVSLVDKLEVLADGVKLEDRPKPDANKPPGRKANTGGGG